MVYARTHALDTAYVRTNLLLTTYYLLQCSLFTKGARATLLFGATERFTLEASK